MTKLPRHVRDDPGAPASRIGILGGTFDPPHTGHLIVASEAFELLQLDRLVFVPAADPPHKSGRVTATPSQRLEMIRAAIGDDDRFVVDDLELRRGGVSYTVDTLRELRVRHPEAEFFFLMGVDQLRELQSWREPEEVTRLACVGVLTRAGDAPPPDTPWQHRLVSVTRVDVSATEIRRRVAEGRSIRYLVPEPVRDIIERAGLYR